MSNHLSVASALALSSLESPLLLESDSADSFEYIAGREEAAWYVSIDAIVGLGISPRGRIVSVELLVPVTDLPVGRVPAAPCSDPQASLLLDLPVHAPASADVLFGESHGVVRVNLGGVGTNPRCVRLGPAVAAAVSGNRLVGLILQSASQHATGVHSLSAFERRSFSSHLQHRLDAIERQESLALGIGPLSAHVLARMREWLEDPRKIPDSGIAWAWIHEEAASTGIDQEFASILSGILLLKPSW